MSNHTMKNKLLLLIVPCIVIISIFLLLEAKKFHDEETLSLGPYSLKVNLCVQF